MVVVGSLNMDLVVKAPRLPAVGETVTRGTFGTFPGGKGANQAVAAARLGASVRMVGAIGKDSFGTQLKAALRHDGVDVSGVVEIDDAPSGVAMITVGPQGENTIVVAPGANFRLTAAHVDAAAETIARSQILLIQLEIPLDTATRAAEIAANAHVRVVLDPAPAPDSPLPDRWMRLVNVITPNEVEAKALTGTNASDERGAREAAEKLLARGCRSAVIKLGARGAFVADGDVRTVIPAIYVDAVDTTAAGDAFAGALGVALGEGRPLTDAVRFANVAGAISVTRMGAQPSMPRRAEIVEFAAARKIPL
ncbi:MAG: ribokinase [bacterium]